MQTGLVERQPHALNRRAARPVAVKVTGRRARMIRSLALAFASLLLLGACFPGGGLPSAPPMQPSKTPTAATSPATPVSAGPTAEVQVFTSEPTAKPQAPAARWIAVIGLDANVYLADPLSSERKQVTADATGMPEMWTASTGRHRAYYCCSAWSSDGELLAFRGTTQEDTEAGTQVSTSIWVYDVESDVAKEVVKRVNPSSLSFRPGTHMLAYDETIDRSYFVMGTGQPDPTKARGIMELNADTGETSELVKPEHGLWLSEPRWSPDGKLLGFVEQTLFEEPGPFAVYDFENQVYGAWNQVVGSYTFAPDGMYIAYDRLSLGGFAGNERIWVSDIWGKGETAFSPEASPMAHGPAWSPKGDMLAYRFGEPANSPGHVGNLLVIQPALFSSRGAPTGGEARRLGSFGYMGPITWSPDGRHVAFAKGRYEESVINVVSVADGSVSSLGTGYDPNWQPCDSRRSAHAGQASGVELSQAQGTEYNLHLSEGDAR